MDSKFFDIPFRLRSSLSDFICKDGELQNAENVSLISDGSEIADPDFSDLSALTRVPEVDFALLRTTLPGWHLLTDDFPSKSVVASNPSMEYWTQQAAGILALFKSEAEFHNLFVAPFYAMAVWKTVGGAYLSPSSPVMLIPNSSVPLVATEDDFSADELALKVAGAVCSLRCKVKTGEYMRDWVGKIASLEILVSQPLQSYDTFHAFVPSKRVTTDNFCESLDPDSEKISRKQVCTVTLPLAWKAIVKGYNGVDSSESAVGKKFYPFASIPLGEVDLLSDWKSSSLDSRQSSGAEIRYENIENGSVGKNSDYVIVTGTGDMISITTRPIKLDCGGRLKKVNKVYLRGSYDPSLLTIRVDGSRDMIHWWCVARHKGSMVVQLPDASFRFYRVSISGHLPVGSSLQGLSITVSQASQ